MAYATVAELASFMGVATSELPANVARILDDASDLIDYATMNRIDAANAEHNEVAKKAVCQQAEHFIKTTGGAGVEGAPAYKSISIGSLSMTFDTVQGESSIEGLKIAPSARRTLFMAGFLYRGVRTIL